MLVAAGLILVYPGWVQDALGFLLFALAGLSQKLRSGSRGSPEPPGANNVGTLLKGWADYLDKKIRGSSKLLK
jgi:hypothetical protein